MSDWATFVDALLADLTVQVPALRDAIVHRYASWDPEELVAGAGEHHLAVWPAGETAEDASPLVTGPGGDLLVQTFNLVYWEDAGDESARGIVDEQAAAELLDLQNEMRARFYAVANRQLGGAARIRYAGTRLATRSGQTRWIQIGVQVWQTVVAS